MNKIGLVHILTVFALLNTPTIASLKCRLQPRTIQSKIARESGTSQAPEITQDAGDFVTTEIKDLSMEEGLLPRKTPRVTQARPDLEIFQDRASGSTQDRPSGFPYGKVPSEVSSHQRPATQSGIMMPEEAFAHTLEMAVLKNEGEGKRDRISEALKILVFELKSAMIHSSVEQSLDDLQHALMAQIAKSSAPGRVWVDILKQVEPQLPVYIKSYAESGVKEFSNAVLAHKVRVQNFVPAPFHESIGEVALENNTSLMRQLAGLMIEMKKREKLIRESKALKKTKKPQMDQNVYSPEETSGVSGEIKRPEITSDDGEKMEQVASDVIAPAKLVETNKTPREQNPYSTEETPVILGEIKRPEITFDEGKKMEQMASGVIAPAQLVAWLKMAVSLPEGPPGNHKEIYQGIAMSLAAVYKSSSDNVATRSLDLNHHPNKPQNRLHQPSTSEGISDETGNTPVELHHDNALRLSVEAFTYLTDTSKQKQILEEVETVFNSPLGSGINPNLSYHPELKRFLDDLKAPLSMEADNELGKWIVELSHSRNH
ncbi:hypothetical protein PGT21_016174 [Puccinia graminis f. sp. tritici]|uniref:Secreted protein n=1 Tax=Puccinia graminis f. sp. tritici TaxID=56615 RepID=A0A5B0S2I3_PUCGR|nr:hypothetical protein PGT21_016174 [Puccinia graminis f. sp. tritici]KAA1132022.1 hypothetical protein PGTUg99_035825 [Puccinia graminis f. sp. tritici]